MLKRQDITEKLIDDFYDDLDATILNCMAAGVCEDVIRDKFILTGPKLVSDANGVSLSSCIGFKP